MDSLVATAVVSGLFAALVAMAVTRAIERFGGMVGGVLATLPTTVVPASIGLSLRLGNGDWLTEALFTVPVGMLVNAAFLLQWRIWPSRLPKTWSVNKQLAAMVGISLSVWAVFAVAAVAVNTTALVSRPAIVAFGSVCAFTLAGAGIAACFTPLDAPKGTQRVPWRMLCARGGMAALSIFTTVMLSALNGVVAGMASTYPAIFSTIMVGLWVSQGQAVQAGAVGPMMLGSVAVAAYAMLFAGLAPAVGDPFAAAAITWVVAVLLSSVPIAFFLRWRRGVSAAAAQLLG
jgi:hypothetical protein